MHPDNLILKGLYASIAKNIRKLRSYGLLEPIRTRRGML